MLSAAASLGMILLWDVDGGLTQIDKYLYSSEDYIKVNFSIRLSEEPLSMIMSILGVTLEKTSFSDTYIIMSLAVQSGALLACGIVNSGVRNECDPALALLSDYVLHNSNIMRIGAIFG